MRNKNMSDKQLVATNLEKQFYQQSFRQKCLAKPNVTKSELVPEPRAHLAEIGSKATMIVHEMRNPLTTVLMGLSSCQKLDLPEPTKIRLSLALEEAERLQKLVNEILLYAKPLVLQRHDLELNKLIKDTLNLIAISPVALERNIQFVGTAAAVWIKGDRNRLKQLLINLVSNACEAVASGEEVSWRLETNAAQAWISISNGGTIDPEILPKLTEPFFTTKAEGSGLGLAIAKRIVEAHGGKLTIQSSMQGTRVSVGFPVMRTIL